MKHNDILFCLFIIFIPLLCLFHLITTDDNKNPITDTAKTISVYDITDDILMNPYNWDIYDGYDLTGTINDCQVKIFILYGEDYVHIELDDTVIREERMKPFIKHHLWATYEEWNRIVNPDAEHFRYYDKGEIK